MHKTYKGDDVILPKVSIWDDTLISYYFTSDRWEVYLF